MPRRNRPPKREITPDPIYNSLMVERFINRMMRGGKKSTARRMFYQALETIAARDGSDALETFERAVRNVTPAVEVKPRRVGGSTYQVPMEVAPDRARSLAIRWILAAAKARSGRSIAEQLANEFMDAAKGQGTAIKKKDDTHRMAEANRAFSHYRW